MNDTSDLRQVALEGSKLLMSEDPAIQNEGFKKIKYVADAGNVQSKAYMGFILRTGAFGQERDELEAFKYLTEAVAAKDMDATEQLALFYYDRKDYVRSLPLAKEAADSSTVHAHASQIAGEMLIDGLGVPKDQFLGMYYIKMAYEAGNQIATVLYAHSLARGNGCTANPAKAAEILKAEFQRKENYSVAHQLAMIYSLPSLNNEVEKNAWLKKAADLGSPESKSQLQQLDKESELDKLAKISLNGKEYGFFTKSGRVVGVGEKSNTQIYSTGGYNNVPVSVRSQTTRQQTIAILGDDGIAFNVLPDDELPITAGTPVDVIYLGFVVPGEPGTPLNIKSGLPTGVVLKNKNKWLVCLKPTTIAELQKMKKELKAWWLLAFASLFVFPFSTIFGLISLGVCGWRLAKLSGDNSEVHEAIAVRTEKIAQLLLT